MKNYDISPLISPRIAVFPGDCSFSRKEVLSCEQGDHLTLSQMTTTMHLGAHVDSPNHYHKDGAGMSDRHLEYYMGSCQVIRLDIERGRVIQVSDLSGIEVTEKRVLFYTGSFPNPDEWNSDFCGLSAELVDHLHSVGVQLVGIDTPSIDPEDSKTLSAHAAVYKNDMAILEGVTLEAVPAGIYELIALPLKIEGADASPVRAILRSS